MDTGLSFSGTEQLTDRPIIIYSSVYFSQYVHTHLHMQERVHLKIHRRPLLICTYTCTDDLHL